ncbi:MAG: VWA domain-containing protein [Butyrivibrio sp.]|uniref:cobaltochelatase CobT-related protein n=1 Tax=Butyrivibrio sp. TaxID=28121 RepID=UPI001B67D43D|nr:VWA domain-containing protein [Butyrivibrio sp.]MBP3782676.1 VWA domain-containing protein [Butyrivibrio sp.]
MDERVKQRAFASSLGRTGSSLLKTVHVGVNWLFGDDLGYTSMGSRNSCIVNVAWDHKVMEDLSEEEKDALRTGVFAHELLHQLLTNFSYTNRCTEKMSRAEAGIFMQFANTIEDPAIEYFADQCFGGRLLESLRFSIKHIYKVSPGIEHSSSAFGQLINALINFGDMGLVKGKWTFPEAKEYFIKVAPIYNEAITTANSQKRIDYAKECMEITRPLWEELVKEQEFFEKLMEELAEFLKRNGAHIMANSEDEMDSSSSGSKAQAKRNSAVAKMKSKSSEKSEDEDKEGEGDGEGEDGKESEEEAKNEGGSSDAENGNGESLDKGKAGKSSEGQSSDSKQESDGKRQEGEGGKIDYSDSSDDEDDFTASEEVANEEADDTVEISDELLDDIEESIKTEATRMEKSEKSEEAKTDELPDFDITSPNFKRRTPSCKNRRIKDTTGGHMSQMYAEAVRAYQPEIKNLTKTLNKIFQADKEQSVAATSGDYNIIRGSLGTTARVFDRRRDPAKLKDAAVVLLVDLSGSMSGRKEAQARKTAITMAEALTACHIPYYIIGFHADCGADAVHDHYVTWANKKSDRESLISMYAADNNFDGYSIRYAAELLKTRQEDNKILFVISDGQPACYSYDGRTGIADTIDAIKVARKQMTVFGIAVGRSCGPTLLQQMYGKDFIFVEDERLLTNMLCKKLAKVIAKK